MITTYLMKGNVISLIASVIILVGPILLDLRGLTYAVSLPFIINYVDCVDSCLAIIIFSS